MKLIKTLKMQLKINQLKIPFKNIFEYNKKD